MSYHTVLKSSKEYIAALKYARYIAKNLTAILNQEGVEIFAYRFVLAQLVNFYYRWYSSVFYVYYEQYLTIWTDFVESITYSLLLVFGVTFILTGLDLFAAIVILMTVSMIILHMLGMMYVWNISLNAVSLVNLIMVGINQAHSNLILVRKLFFRVLGLL